MRDYITTLVGRYKAISQRAFYIQSATGFFILVISLFFNNYASHYTAIHSGASVSDIILDNVRVLDVETIFVEGFIIYILFVVFLALHKPARVPFILKSSALFICIRAFFLILTHLGPPLQELVVHTANIIERTVAGSDAGLFFSGHTGSPFLMALVFWHNMRLRITFLLTAIFFGGVVLVGHLHYSIDVFSAFFITYGIFHIAVRLFRKDYELFMVAE